MACHITQGLRNGHKPISYHKTLFISKQIVVDRELKSRYKLQANVAKSSSLVDYCLILNRGNRASETEQRKSCFHEKPCVPLPSFELFKL